MAHRSRIWHRKRAACIVVGLGIGMALLLAASKSNAEPLAQRLHPVDPYRRAGNPQSVHRFARPTFTPHYSVGYVGGGATWGGEPRTLEEGTWGMDYTGHFLPHRVWQNWYHGRRAQGGPGKYQTDGPHLLKKK